MLFWKKTVIPQRGRPLRSLCIQPCHPPLFSLSWMRVLSILDPVSSCGRLAGSVKICFLFCAKFIAVLFRWGRDSEAIFLRDSGNLEIVILSSGVVIFFFYLEELATVVFVLSLNRNKGRQLFRVHFGSWISAQNLGKSRFPIFRQKHAR